LSIFTVTLLIERFMYYRSAAGDTDELIEKIKQTGTLAEDPPAIEHAPGIAGRVIPHRQSRRPAMATKPRAD